ncbi:MAG: hypothetical protein HY644_11570 [Acidobacteria bacterium]|nr:hypothetical protein [Acidobacteriota bacterium]
MNILMWSYARGTWQYDVMCALIIAFIVLTPRNFLQGDFTRVHSAVATIQDASPPQNNPPDSEIDKERKITGADKRE